MNKIEKIWYSCKEIGIPQLVDYAGYLVQKKTGLIAKATPLGGFTPDFKPQDVEIRVPFDPFNAQLMNLIENNRAGVLKRAEEILNGWYHPFGGEKKPLSFETGMGPSNHYLAAGDQVNGRDIKWLWEPARFSWAFDLAKAWLLTKEDRYVDFFWHSFSEFNRMNPVNSAPNWSSAQEAAMRILVWGMVYQVFKDSPATTAENTTQLKFSIWQHAARIPPTLGYARSQNNNHLLSEALGLTIAGSIFSDRSSQAKKWLHNGIKLFNQAVIKQIQADGTYAQHSANYHRLMLQLALVYNGYAKLNDFKLPREVNERLAAATRWLAAQMDPFSGRLPNLGHNDGSLLLPFGTQEFRDYRPTLQAAGLTFLDQTLLPSGSWDELSLWLDLKPAARQSEIYTLSSPAVYKLEKSDARVFLRGVQFKGRPAHADQLHLDLWWDGFNIAQDAGTFSYNDAPPWQNPFSTTLTHNTISVDEQDQMKKASKFLWLKQAQATWQNSPSKDILMASHSGYKRLGVNLQRMVTFTNHKLVEIVDQVHFIRKTAPKNITLQWLLPDWPWQLNENVLLLKAEERWVKIGFHAILKEDESLILPEDVALIQGGKTIKGKRQNPVLGWASDTYGEKHTALSLSVKYQTNCDLQIVSHFEFHTSQSSLQG